MKESSGKVVGVELDEKYKKSAEDLGKSGWIIPMDLPIYTPIEICNCFEEIDKIMFCYYSNDIQFTNMIGELVASKIAKKYRTIILQSYCAYKMNLFSICISSLNPLYEGFLSELIQNKKEVNLKRMLQEIKDKYFVKNNKSLINQSVELIYLNIEAFFEKYTKNQPFTELQKEYGRHNIAHGRIFINDDQLQVIKMFSNLYNIVIFFSNHIE
jgi:uncharacterized protein YbcV (DUF1398 family)